MKMRAVILLMLFGVSSTFAGILLKNFTSVTTESDVPDMHSSDLKFVKFNNRSRSSNGNNWNNCRSCGLVQRNRIVGGRKASIHDFPWMVSIQKNKVQHCGASVLDKRHLLTAAHCMIGLEDTSSLVAIAATTNVYAPTAFRAKIQSFITHPRFVAETFDYDMAVLTLETDIPLSDGSIRPICLPDSDDDPTGGVGVVSGWGATTETANVAPEELRKVDLPIITNDECRKVEGLKTQLVSDRMMCAGYVRGGMDACAGDSGGPLVWNYQGRWKQVGVVSWGIGCARKNYVGVFTKVTTMLEWLASNVENAGCD